MNEVTTNIQVLIVAAGIGSRFNSKSDLPKQYHLIGNKTVLAHSIEAFNTVKCNGITVTTHSDDCWWKNITFQSTHEVKQCSGGDSRNQSVINGLNAIKQNHKDGPKDIWVLIHDAARPCVTPTDLERLISQCQSHNIGGLLVKPITDTIKYSDDEKHSSRTINRDQLFAAMTPQMFKLDDLLTHLQQAIPDMTTDDASAFEQAGLQPLLVQGNGQNIKITYPEDLTLAHFYLQQQGRL